MTRPYVFLLLGTVENGTLGMETLPKYRENP
jgi:hypothetical protein